VLTLRHGLIPPPPPNKYEKAVEDVLELAQRWVVIIEQVLHFLALLVQEYKY
jgi:hypothetical protein